VLGISDLVAYSMASNSNPTRKEDTLLELQFDYGFLKQLKELITQVIQDERSTGQSPPQTPLATRHCNHDYNLPRMKMDFP
jgi:hypothetical protein